MRTTPVPARRHLVTALAFAMFACAATPAAAPPRAPEPAAAAPSRAPERAAAAPDAWQACNVDADCELLSTSCCWECQAVYAIAVAHREEARARYERVCVADLVCTDNLIGCGAATPICRDHVCGYRSAATTNTEVFPRLPAR